MLNDTREDMRNMSREQSTALELAQNSTVTELVRVSTKSSSSLHAWKIVYSIFLIIVIEYSSFNVLINLI